MDSIASTLTGMAGRLDRWPAGIVNRVIGAAIGAPNWMVIGIASQLDPSPTGVGTHVQLGMGGCMMLMMTGYPCPMCGMTTTFALMAHLHPVSALLNQPFGPVLFMVCFAGAAIGLADVITGRGFWRRGLALVDRHEQRIAIGLLIGLFVGWFYKVLLMHPEILHQAG